MQGLPAETVQGILMHIGRSPQLAFVCRQWRDIVGCAAFVRACVSRRRRSVYAGAFAAHLIRNDQLKLFDWARANGCPIDERTWAEAAAQGHLDILSALALSPFAKRSVESAHSGAAGAGRLDVLVWLRSQGYAWDVHWTRAQAARNGHIHVLEWIHARDSTWTSNVCAQAAAGGQLETLKWLHAHGYGWDQFTCAMAARIGRLDILDWARRHGAPLNSAAHYHAMRGGHLNLLPWLRQNAGISVSCQRQLCCGAARGGHLWLLQDLTCGRLEMLAGMHIYAARGGHVDVLEWLRGCGCSWDAGTCVAAATKGRTDTIAWLSSRGCPWSAGACTAAARGGHIGTLEWLVANGCPYNRDACLDAAKASNLCDVVAWIQRRLPSPSNLN